MNKIEYYTFTPGAMLTLIHYKLYSQSTATRILSKYFQNIILFISYFTLIARIYFIFEVF